MPNVGYATLQVIPSVRGIADDIRSQLNAPMQAAGQEAGNTAGQGILSGVGGAMKAGMLAVGAAGGAIFAKGFGDALEQGQVVGKLRAQLGATPQEAAKYGKVAGKLYSGAVSETFADAADAIKSVVQQGLVPPEATNKQLESISAKAANLANVMGEDVNKAAAAVATIMRNRMAPDASAAMDLLTRGMQTGANKSEDLLDTFIEYPVILTRLGLDGQTAMGLLSQGLKAGARDADTVADGLKEFQIRATDGSTASADAFKLLGLDATKMTAQIAAGGTGASAGLQLVLDKLRATEDPVKRNAAAVGLFGTKAEDMASALFALDPRTAVNALGQVTGAAEQLGVALGDNAGARIEVFKRSIEQAFTEFIGGKAIPALTQFSQDVRSSGGFVRDELVPPVRAFGGYLVEHLAPGARDVADVLAKYLVPPARELRDLAVQIGPPLGAVALALGVDLLQAAESVGRFIVETLLPGLADMVVWLDRNRENIVIVAGVIGFILLPILVQLGVQMLIAGGRAVVAAAMTVGSWIASAAAAVVNAALISAAYIIIGIDAVISAAKQVAASWAVVGGWIAAGAAAVWNAAIVVGQWILMGTQSLLQAGRMAAAWLIAMGPIPWVIAAVVGLAAIIFTNWDKISSTTKQVFGEVAGWAKWLYDQFADWFGKIGSVVGSVVGGFKDGFRLAKEGIAEVWSGMSEVAAAPVRFVVDKVYNQGIARVWNWIAGKVGLPELAHVQLAFASGGVVPAGSYGVLPGYAPGRDTMLAAVSPGEGWLRPEVVRWMGADTLHALNYRGRTGQLGDGMPAFGLGGVVGSVVKKVKNAATAIPGVSDVVDFIGDIARGALAKAAERGLAPVRALINSMPGDSSWAQGMKGLPLAGIDGAIKWLKGEDERDGGDRLVNALGWARSQAGKPYQWGGGGNPSWDCSGFMAGIEQVLRGNAPSRLYTTFDFQGASAPPGWKQNKKSAFMVGITNVGSGHMAGTLSGVNVESRGGDGIVVGPGARGWNDSLFYDHYGFVGTHDRGGWMMPGVPAINRTPKPEAVLTDAQWQSVDANRVALERAIDALADRNGAPLIGTYNAAADDDPHVMAERLYNLRRSRRGPRG